MDIGLLLHTRQILRQEEAARSFEQLWEDAAQAEQLGFDHIWLGDSVTVLDKARGDCLTTMAALAARTSKIRIGAVPPHEKAGRLGECIEIMRQLWTEKAINYDGRYYKLSEVGILPHPTQKP